TLSRHVSPQTPRRPYPRNTEQMGEMIGIVRQVQTSPTRTRFASDPVPAGILLTTKSPQPVAPNTAQLVVQLADVVGPGVRRQLVDGKTGHMRGLRRGFPQQERRVLGRDQAHCSCFRSALLI